MAKKNIPRPYNNGTMTAAEKHSMITGVLRKLSMGWKPITKTKANARVARGIYKCQLCGKEGKEFSPPPPGKKRRIKNFAVDHKIPAVGVEGFKSYHELISNTFIEMGDGLRLLCKECHDKKSKKENEDRRIFKKLNNPEGK